MVSNKIFTVTVIIPVFNAVHFIEKSVLSAADLEAVGEVIVINDGSTDGTKEKVIELARNNQKVKYFEHEGCKNLGPAASRNLGIMNATLPVIAFLDADDFYLDNRFKVAEQIFTMNENVDGIYEPVVISINSVEGRERFLQKGKTVANGKVIYCKETIPWQNLFYDMLDGSKGTFHLDGLTVKRELLGAVGMFDNGLYFAEDSILKLKLAHKGRLIGNSDFTPVAVRIIHDSNLEPSISEHHLFLKYNNLLKYFLNQEVSSSVIQTLLRRKVSHKVRDLVKVKLLTKSGLVHIPIFIFEIIKSPTLLLKLF